MRFSKYILTHPKLEYDAHVSFPELYLAIVIHNKIYDDCLNAILQCM